MYDLIIIGGGPAGAAAGVYAGRKKLKTLLITEEFGGQSVVSDGIENWIGEKKITGWDLAKKLEEHVRAQESVEIKMSEKVTAVNPVKELCVSCCDWQEYSEVAEMQDSDKHCAWEVLANKGTYKAKALLIVAGAHRKKLGVPGEDKLNGKGVSYCSTCDAPLFRDKEVAVVGGGYAAQEAVIDLLLYVNKIYVLNIEDKLRGDQSTRNEIEKSDKVEIINRAETKEILGDKFVTGLKYNEQELKVGGVFVEIGSVPNSDFLKGIVKLNEHQEIVIDHKTSATSRPGIFAAGDITDEIYKQNNIAVGDAITATLSAYNYLLDIKKKSPAAE